MKLSSGRILDRFLGKIESAPSSDRLLLRLAFFIIIGTGIWLIFSLNQQHSELSATTGGSITEGIVGTPRFVNPALALTRADQDVTALIYRGLLKISPDGTLEYDVAESIETSEDGLTYTITIKQGITFHDQSSLRASDVVYTIQLIQDPDLKSPLRGNWTDVVVEEVEEYKLTISLLEPYAPFIENFTLGIMPDHLWNSLPIEQLPFSQLNTEPIGSGPFAVTAAKRDQSGLINQYTLTAYRENESNPNLNTIELAFYQNEEDLLLAMQEDKIDATAYISASNISSVLTDDFELIEKPLPRTFGIFFNQNRSTMLRDSAAREALTVALDRDALIEESLSSYGIPIYGPTAFSISELESIDSEDQSGTSSPQSRAIEILEAGGWVKNESDIYEKEIDDSTITLSITLKTSNAPLFQTLVKSISEQWNAIGVEVITEQYEQTGLIQSVIRPRDFQALLFGLDMSRTYDLYPFWHSSQQDDPGLNIAQYANVSVDALLETARTEQDLEARNLALEEASAIITEETPAIFLFQPTLTYLVSTDITVAPIGALGRPSDRFNSISEWHTESDSLWPIFRQDI